MSEARLAQSPSAVRLRRIVRTLRIRRSRAREVIVAVLLAGAISAGYAAQGGKIELWSRLQLWYAEKGLLARQFLLTSRAAREPAAPAGQSAGDFRLKHDPFLTFTKRTGFRFHPLIDFVGADFNNDKDFFMGQTTEHYWEERDFFGFRNNFNAYFVPGDFTYIVMTGNSELVGFTHQTTIAQNLEKILNARTGGKYRVLNLALNSATTANEINYFVNLAFNLHPEFVISHSFAMDMLYGYEVAPEFQALGLFYPVVESAFSKHIHAGNYDPRAFEVADQAASENHLLEGSLRNLYRYQALAKASGAKFILGVQKFDAGNVKGLPGAVGEVGYDRVNRMYKKLKDIIAHGQLSLDVIDFNTYAGIELRSPTDAIHTTEASSLRIAEIYADHILTLEKAR